MMNRGQGEVFVYKDMKSNELVVIKKYSNLGDEKAKSAFEKERDKLKKLQSKHIVRFYNSFSTDNMGYWVSLLWPSH